jgi:hypothetical protein
MFLRTFSPCRRTLMSAKPASIGAVRQAYPLLEPTEFDDI